jgi:hypothetical protein
LVLPAQQLHSSRLTLSANRALATWFSPGFCRFSLPRYQAKQGIPFDLDQFSHGEDLGFFRIML